MLVSKLGGFIPGKIFRLKMGINLGLIIRSDADPDCESRSESRHVVIQCSTVVAVQSAKLFPPIDLDFCMMLYNFSFASSLIRTFLSGFYLRIACTILLRDQKNPLCCKFSCLYRSSAQGQYILST